MAVIVPDAIFAAVIVLVLIFPPSILVCPLVDKFVIVTYPVGSSLLACIFIASADWLIVDIIAPLSVLFATVVVNPFTVAVISVTLLLALFAVVSIDDILPLKPLTVCSN